MDPRIISSPSETSKFPRKSAGEIIFDRLKTFQKDSIAFLEIKSITVCTYGDLVTTSVNLAASLRKTLGITKNDHFAIISENSYKFWVAALAGLYLAAPFHLLNPGYTIYEMKKFLMMSKPKLVFCSKQNLTKLKSIKNECEFIESIVLLDDDDKISDVTLFKKLIENKYFDFDFEKVDDLENQVAYIANSSGTTGVPKGVMITHANIIFNLSHIEYYDIYPFNKENTILHVIPFYHVHGCGICYCGLYRGVKILIMDQFLPKIFLETIQNYKVNKLFVVPTLADFLANSPLVDFYDVSSVDGIFSAAGGIKETTQTKILQKFDIKSIRHIYGLTEIASAIFLSPQDSPNPESCGKITPGTSAKIVDPKTGELLSCNKPGEIYVKAAAMKGYIGDVENTRLAFDSHGYIRTGDLGYYDENNYFYIIDRLKDMIKYKSFQVAPLEIEEILIQHPGVKDVAVVGKPDDRYGELAVAFVVKEGGVEVGEEDIRDFLTKFVCAEKRLHGGVQFVEEIPRNTIGKILRKDLRKLFEK